MSNKGQMLQDPFLNTLRKEHVPVSIYLVNGIKLQGQIESFDQYVVLLKNTVTQMVYKHAISTVVPSRPVAMPHHDPTTTPKPDRIACTASTPSRRTPCARLMLDPIGRAEAGGNRALLVALDFGDGDRAMSAWPELARARQRRPAPMSWARVTGRRAASRSRLLRRQGQGRGDRARCARDRRRPRDLRPPALRRAAAQPRAGARVPRRSTAPA